MSKLHRRALLALLGLAGVAAGGVWWWKVARRPMDIIIVVGDCLRADRVGAAASASLTPFLDELARGGTRFTRAYAASSWTMPSVASLVTSRYPTQHGVNTYDARLRDDEVTINERLRAAGYVQVGFTANFRLDEAHGFAQGYTAWFPFVPEVEDPLVKPRAPHIIGAALAFVDDVLFSTWRRFWPRPPFLFYFHFMEPHGPYLPSAADRKRFGVDGDEERMKRLNRTLLRHEWTDLSPADVATLGALYDAEVESLDAALRDLFAGLERLGLLRHALVFVTADHGEEFGEHGQMMHGIDLYDEVLHVPLLVRGPGVSAGAVVATPVSLLDVAPTILDLLHLAPEPRFVGRSRADWLRAAPRGGDDVLAELLPLGNGARDLAHQRAALIRGAGKVISERGGAGKPDFVREGYDLAADPRERHPLPPDPKLVTALEEKMARLAESAQPAARRELDEATRQRLRALGYAVDEEAPPAAGE